MHPAAKKWDHQRILIQRFDENGMKNGWYEVRRNAQEGYVPEPERPCDVCGEPVGIRGRYVHPFCAVVERTVMTLVAKLQPQR